MRTFLFFLSVIFVSSCAVYTPNSLNVTGFNKKGQVSVNANAGNTANLQAAIAVSDNFGVMANLMSTSQVVDSDNIKRDGKGNLFEIGVGYFKNTDFKVRFEFFGGGGIGNVEIIKTNASVTRNFSTKANRFFLQPSLGFSGRNFEAFISTRLANVRFNNIETTYSTQDLIDDSFVDISNSNWMFIEPALTLRVGLKNIKFQMQVGRSIKLNTEKLGYDSGLLNFGIYTKF
jgi:hypothetical protein